MRVKSRRQTLQFPVVHLPESERDEARELFLNLTRLGTYSLQFEAALRLADHADGAVRQIRHAMSEKGGQRLRERREFLEEQMNSLQIYNGWLHAAALEAAMALDAFNHITKQIFEGADAIPTIAKLYDRNKHREAQVKFSEHFGDPKRVRNALGHYAERGSSQRERAEHALSGVFQIGDVSLAGTGLTWSGMSNRTLHMSWKRKVVSLTFDEAALDALIEVEGLIRAAFEPTFAALFEQFIQTVGRPPSFEG